MTEAPLAEYYGQPLKAHPLLLRGELIESPFDVGSHNGHSNPALPRSDGPLMRQPDRGQVCHAPTELDSTLRAGRRRRATAEDAVKVAGEDGRPALGVEGNLIKRRALGVEHGVLPASWEERGV